MSSLRGQSRAGGSAPGVGLLGDQGIFDLPGDSGVVGSHGEIEEGGRRKAWCCGVDTEISSILRHKFAFLAMQ